jgi:hypothetical protein
MKPVNIRDFRGNQQGNIGVRYHNGTEPVIGYVVRQIGTKRYVVTSDGVTTFTVQLAQTTALAQNLTAGYCTIEMFSTSDGSGPYYVKVMRMTQAVTTDDEIVFWKGGGHRPGGNPIFQAFEMTTTPIVGVAVAPSFAAIIGGPSTETYQWLLDGDVVATTELYTPLIGDLGKTLVLVMTVTTGTGRTVVSSPPQIVVDDE